VYTLTYKIFHPRRRGSVILRRRLLLIIAVSAFLAVTVSGTYAWRQISSQAFIDISGQNGGGYTLAGGTLHNDGRDGQDFRNIYIENWGTRPIYARIRLREYMETDYGGGYKSLMPGEDINNPGTWSVHIPAAADTPNICGDTGGGGEGFHTYWLWKMGGWKYYYPAPDEKRGAVVGGASYVDCGSPAGLNAQSPNSAYGKPVSRTLDAEVLTMRQWLNAGHPIGGYWVIDTDGWAYWADLIKPGTATGLLLDSTALARPVGGAYHYKISVEAQMATKTNETNTYDDYNTFGLSGWTDNGRGLMDLITSNDHSSVKTVSAALLTSSLPVIDGKIYIRQGSDVDLGLSYEAAGGSDISAIPDRLDDAWLTWLPQRGVWNLAVSNAAKAFSSYTLTLKANKQSEAAASAVIVVIPGGCAGVITGRGGAPILDYGDGSYRPVYEGDKGVFYPSSWISGADLGNDGFAIVSTLPIYDGAVYVKQGQSFGLTVTGASPGFKRIAGNFPVDNKYYSVHEMLSMSSCTVKISPEAPAGTRFTVIIGQYSADNVKLGEQRSIDVIVVPKA